MLFSLCCTSSSYNNSSHHTSSFSSPSSPHWYPKLLHFCPAATSKRATCVKHGRSILTSNENKCSMVIFANFLFSCKCVRRRTSSSVNMFASNANACVFRELDAFASSNTFEQTKMPSHIDGFATDCGDISESSRKNCPESVALCSSSSFLMAAVGAFFANWSAWKAMDSFFESSNSNILVSQSFSRVGGGVFNCETNACKV